MAPRGLHDDINMAQEGFQIGTDAVHDLVAERQPDFEPPRRPKDSPRWLQDGPTWPQEGPTFVALMVQASATFF